MREILCNFGVEMPVPHSPESALACPIPGGFLLVIDGIDGCGKSTQIEMVARFCSENRLAHVISKEPTNGQFGLQIRKSAEQGRLSVDEEIDLLRQDREEHVERIISPAIRAEKIVILDRYYFSTAAYQGAQGANPDEILEANERFCPQPDLLIILDVSVETGVKRIRKRGDQPNKFEGTATLEKARAIFNQIRRPYKREINGEAEIGWVSFQVAKLFQAAAINKIAQRDFSTSGLNRIIEFLGDC